MTPNEAVPSMLEAFARYYTREGGTLSGNMAITSPL